MLKQRLISALWGIPLVFAAIWFGDPWFTILVSVIAVLAAFEFYKMISSKVSPWTLFGLIWVVLMILSAHSDDDRIIPLLISSAVVVSLVWYIWRPTPDAFSGWVWTLAGILYIGWMLSHLVGLRRMDEGRDWVLLIIFATFATDTVAYLLGRAFGRHHMAPAISPGKTWEGAAGGMIGGLASTVALAFILDLTPDPLNYPGVIILGLLIPIFAQLGDLAESLLKRTAGVKDAGHLIPGHGGMLDRMDSIIFVCVLVYYYVIWVI